MDFEKSILFNLCENNDYTQAVNVYIKPEYFEDYATKEIFKYVDEYIKEYKASPTKSILQYEISKSSKYNEKQYENILSTLDSVFKCQLENTEWLIKETEAYCQNIAFSNAIMKCYEIYENSPEKKDAAIEIMRDALRVEFDSESGIDFFSESDIEKRHQKYNEENTILKTGLETFDIVCGLKPKTVTCLLGTSGAGKTASKISIAAHLISQGIDVAYFTFEMAEEEIAKRVEAHLLDIEINNIKDLDIKSFRQKLTKLKEKSYGRLRIKEYPPVSASCIDMEKQLDDWKIKDDFKPQVIIGDYLNIIKSSRIKEANSYVTVKSVAEEFRGLCIKKKAAGLTSTQTNRDGMQVSKLSYTNMSDSVGVIYTVDNLIGILSNEQMRSEGFQIWQNLKCRNTGIIDYFYPMLTKFEYSKLIDGHNKITNNEILLNNSDEMIMRVEALRRGESRSQVRKFDEQVKLIKKQKEAFKFKIESEDSLDFLE